MREREVEQKLLREVKELGGLCLKFVSPGWSGAPDRLVLFPGGKIAFVEVKAPGEKARPLQLRRKRQLEVMGFKVFVLDDPFQIKNLIQTISDSQKTIGGDGDA